MTTPKAITEDEVRELARRLALAEAMGRRADSDFARATEARSTALAEWNGAEAAWYAAEAEAEAMGMVCELQAARKELCGLLEPRHGPDSQESLKPSSTSPNAPRGPRGR